ncbi:hypothetical protein L3556_07305 [Candidatus Synechococcus calcipolaris G9]|uniref:Uncharacterized protein n=1 Tax=Candidatus Synechococcus calcipolaris G9 TaxID=1497997 RepID=A0ABT6EZ38_9SYNE|nr:hypothetical protein [Candidatus Synechococcus calcipolaris]MDG2990738.1 hypothetical protein [Candidatus Synechococcus calcipolaris G9]
MGNEKVCDTLGAENAKDKTLIGISPPLLKIGVTGVTDETYVYQGFPGSVTPVTPVTPKKQGGGKSRKKDREMQPSSCDDFLEVSHTNEPDPIPVGSRFYLRHWLESLGHSPEWWTVAEQCDNGFYLLESDGGRWASLDRQIIERDIYLEDK